MSQGDRRCWTRSLALIGLLLVVGGLYAGVLDHPMIIDDGEIISRHPDVIEPAGIGDLWTHDYWAGKAPYANLYRPVSIISYYLNARLQGVADRDDAGRVVRVSPVTFRLINIVLLALLAWTVGLWLEVHTSALAAWSAALLLAVHPSCAFLINHIVGRADLLAMLGVVGVLCIQRHAISRGRWSVTAMVAALLLAALAVGSKETGVLVIPGALTQWWIMRPRSRRVGTAAPGTLRGLLPTLIVIGVPVLAYGVARVVVLHGAVADQPDPSGDLSGNPLRGVAFLDRLPAALSIAWWYARQVFWPDTGFFHTPNVLPSWGSATTWLGVTVLLGIVGLYVLALRRRVFLATAVAVGLGQYLLVGNLLVHIGSYAANRMMLPFLFAVAALLAGALHRCVVPHPRSRLVTAAVILAVAIASGMVVVRDVNVRWSSWIALAEADVRDEPDNLVNQYHYALALLLSAKYNPQSLTALRSADHAAKIIEAALRQRPESRQARYQLAHTYLQLGREDQARREYVTLLELEPNHAKGVRDMGILELRQGRTDAAGDLLMRAATLLPDDDAMLQQALSDLRLRAEPPPP